MLNDLTENLIQKNQLFMCFNALTILRVFLDVSWHSAFTHDPCGLFLKKANIDKTTSTISGFLSEPIAAF